MYWLKKQLHCCCLDHSLLAAACGVDSRLLPQLLDNGLRFDATTCTRLTLCSVMHERSPPWMVAQGCGPCTHLGSVCTWTPKASEPLKSHCLATKGPDVKPHATVAPRLIPFGACRGQMGPRALARTV